MKELYKTALQYIGITVAVALIAVSINLFLQPHAFAPGGVSGVSIILNKASNGFIPVWLSNLVLNIPIFIGSILALGKTFGAKSLYGIISLSFFIWLIPGMGTTNDLLLASIFGGVIMGLGIGIVFRSGGTTGGSDTLGLLLNRKFPGIGISQFMLMIDSMVVIGSGIVTKSIEIPLYSIIVLYISSRVIDVVLNGLGYAKAVHIISNEPEKIGKSILENLNRGVTVLKGKGFYTGKDREVLLCIIGRSQIVKLKDLVDEIDKRAFIMVTDATEVLGEGFKPIKKS